MMDFIAWMETSFGTHIDWKQVILGGMAPVFLLAFLLEWQFQRRHRSAAYMQRQFAWRDVLTNLSLGALYQAFELLVHGVFVGAAVFWFWQHRLQTLPITPWTLPPIFVGVEFCYYWFHRASHRIRWFWSAHVVHHSGEQMNMTTAMRQSMLYPLTGWWLFFMPLVLLGVHPAVVFVLYACDLVYQYFIHTDAIGKLHPLLEYLFDTPSHHRVHHGRNPQYIDRNYGGVLIVFDRWFGTYVAEDAPVDYGIATRQPHTHHPLRLNFHEFIDMWKDVGRPGALSLRLKHLWAAPEWQRPRPPAASAATQRTQKQRA